MSLPPFKPCIPSLLFTDSTSPPNNIPEQNGSQIPIYRCIIGTWKMIASSSTMWQDKKSCITITYTNEDSTDPRKVHDVAVWRADRSTTVSSTKGISTPLDTEETCRIYNWKGAGWLRMISTRWEIVAVGVIYEDTAASKDGKSDTEGDLPVLVTFVQKTLFSPQALSIYVLREHLDADQQQAIFATVKETLQELGCEVLQVEIEKMRTIPQTL